MSESGANGMDVATPTDSKPVVTIEDLYRCFGVLADANDQIDQVRNN